MILKLFNKTLQRSLPLIGAIAVLFSLFAPAKGYVTYSLNNNPMCWDLTSLPDGQIRWSLAPDAPEDLRASVLFAIEQWTKATDGTLKFVEGPGGIEISWCTDSAQVSDPIILAYTNFSLNKEFHITTARIIVNAAHYNWHRGAPFGIGGTKNNKCDANLDGVILHELGHALGLDHADKNRPAIVGSWGPLAMPTMNSAVYPGSEDLHIDDIVGIRSIYLHDTSIPEPEISISGSPAKGPRPLNVSFMQTCGDNTTTWDFGDGHTFTGESPSHRYPVAGVYTVTATFNGKSTTMTVEVEKKRARPIRSKRVQRAK